MLGGCCCSSQLAALGEGLILLYVILSCHLCDCGCQSGFFSGLSECTDIICFRDELTLAINHIIFITKMLSAERQIGSMTLGLHCRVPGSRGLKNHFHHVEQRGGTGKKQSAWEMWFLKQRQKIQTGNDFTI